MSLKSTIGRFIVSPVRDIIVDRDNPMGGIRRFGFGSHASYQGPDVNRPIPLHRREYTEADAVAVCEYLNQRVTSC